jgi:ribonuclease HII
LNWRVSIQIAVWVGGRTIRDRKKAKSRAIKKPFVGSAALAAMKRYWLGVNEKAAQHLLGRYPGDAARGPGVGSKPQHLLIDAKRLKEIDIPQQAIVKGDAKSASIAAASILAKVSRDAVMGKLDTRHPGYGFADHKGYPVRAHYAALSRLGACAVHRRSFGPVRKVLGLPPLPPWPSASERVIG